MVRATARKTFTIPVEPAKLRVKKSQYGERMQPVDPSRHLLIGPTSDWWRPSQTTRWPGQRIRQEKLGRSLGLSRQPITHALYFLKQQKLAEESGEPVFGENLCMQE
jgi:hypothetical protein